MKQQYSDLVARCVEFTKFLETYEGPERQELFDRIAIIMDDLGDMEEEISAIEE